MEPFVLLLSFFTGVAIVAVLALAANMIVEFCRHPKEYTLATLVVATITAIGYLALMSFGGV
jgi:hypothetical protein